MDNTSRADYQYIVNDYDYTEEGICERGRYWYQNLSDYIKKAGLTGKVRINPLGLTLMILSYYADIIRLKDFHGIEIANREKVFAYSCYWLMRFKPVQLIGDVDQRQYFVNELFAAHFLVSEFLREDDRLRQNTEFVKRLMRELLYNFKYRKYTQQSIELMLVALSRNASSSEPDMLPPHDPHVPSTV